MGAGAGAESSPGEVTAGRAAVFAAVVMIAQQIAGKATRDALFLSLFPASALPQVMLVAAALSLLAVLAMSRLLARRGPARVIPLCFLVSGMLFAGEWLLAGPRPGMAAWAVYLHTAVFGAIAISGFWSVVGERFDPQTAKIQVARAATGATLGGVIGGIGAERLAGVVSLRGMLLLLAALNVVCAAGVFAIGKPDKPPATKKEQRSGLRIMAETPYLQLLGAIVGLVAVVVALLDYVFKAEAALRLGNGQALMQFFAIFYAATALLTFVVQGLLGKRLLSRLGLNGTIALLPAAVVLFGGLATGLLRLWTVTLLRAAENILENSLFRSGYEILYTPLPPAQKRPTKIAIDVAFKRAGGALGSGVVMLVLWLQPERASVVVVVAALVIGALALLVVRGLHKGYVGALAESLRLGVVELAEEDVIDATTRKTLTETTRALDRDRLLREIAQLRNDQASARPSSRGAPEHTHDSEQNHPASRRGTSHEQDAQPQSAAATLMADIQLLHSDQRDAIAARLKQGIDPPMVAHVLPLLSRRGLERAAHKALATIASQVVGQLVDALLDANHPIIVRRRVARLLGDCDQARAATGLQLGLADKRAEIRRPCGQALAALRQRAPELAALPQEQVYALIRKELAATQAELAPNDSSARATRDHLFALLSLAHDPEPLKLAKRALNANRMMRGTALEYLDAVLPAEVREELWPYLGDAEPPPPSRRSHKQLVDDLLSSADSLERVALETAKQDAPTSHNKTE